jgi:hypothetical protein
MIMPLRVKAHLSIEAIETRYRKAKDCAGYSTKDIRSQIVRLPEWNISD